MAELEIRRTVTAQLRAEQAEGSFRPVLRGYALVFNEQSIDLGGFVEIIRPEAMRRTMEEKIDLRALVDHDTAKVIGRISAGTLRIRVDARGLQVEIHPPNTSVGRDVTESVRRGDIDEMSFAFQVMNGDSGGVKWHFDEEPFVREVFDMRCREVSVVAFAAFPQTDVSVAQRMMQEARARQQRASIAILREQMEAKRAAWR